jgi:DNA repair protein RecN (Recombination protein N)
LLDEYAGHQSLIKTVKGTWEKWQQSQKELLEKQAAMDQAREDEAFYRTSLEDIDALDPKAEEETELTQLRFRLMQREQILDGLNEAQKGIEEIESQAGSVWRALERLGEDGQEAIAAMDRANAEIQEVLSSLTALSDDIDNNEYSLSEIDDRLFALKAQAKKHSCTIDTLPQKRDELAAALDAIDNQDDHLASLQREVEKNKQVYSENAEKLSASRQKTAEKLSKLVMKELPALKLDKARFEVSVEKLGENEWGKNGFDQVQFLVAPNPGAAAGPLNKIASGGEMSRFMLALKVVMAEVGLEDTLIFDEVDSGIGGATAAAVGERLLQLAAHRQILVVTHSPQVAAVAAHHWIVSKEGKKEVITNIIPLFETTQRQEEIARMLSGAEITAEARAAAGKLLEASAA